VVTHAELVRFLAKTNPNMSERNSYQVLEMLGYTPETRLAILPLQSEERLIGMLWLWGTDLQAADLPAMRIFSGQVALSLERIRLIERLRNQQERLKNLTNRLVEVQEAERRHLALELHDEVGQDLTGLKMILAGRMESGKEASDPALEVVDRLMEMVRDLSLRLHPPMLDQMGLLPTFLWHIERYTNLTGIRVKIAHQGVKDRRFPAVIENALYRVMQEALTNIARHAEVDFATVRLWAGDDIVELQVEDQGRGFEPQEIGIYERGVGLSGINERVTLLGGAMAVESQPGQGTRLSVEIPIARNSPPPKEQDA
jgi:signal transduction histidine kinase